MAYDDLYQMKFPDNKMKCFLQYYRIKLEMRCLSYKNAFLHLVQESKTFIKCKLSGFWSRIMQSSEPQFPENKGDSYHQRKLPGKKFNEKKRKKKCNIMNVKILNGISQPTEQILKQKVNYLYNNFKSVLALSCKCSIRHW